MLQPLTRNSAIMSGVNAQRAYDLRMCATRKNPYPVPSMHAILSDVLAGINGTLDL
jgi:hypothetical protein